MKTAVRRTIERCGTPATGETLIAGVSGGADSVALLDALVGLSRSMRFRVVAAHLDHRMRPGSGEDAAFCRELCARLGVTLREGAADVPARARRDRAGIEDAARRERYAFLRAVKREEGASAIAVAHTRDDQAETLLLRLLRGAGSRGLGAMREQSRDLFRPLLGVSRRQVLQHLEERGLSWREDPTNEDLTLLRNRVRRELIPYLEARFNPSLREALARSARLLADEADALRAPADALWARAAHVSGGEVMLARGPLREAPVALARMVVRRAIEESGSLRSVGFAHVDRVLTVVRSRSGAARRLPLPGGRIVAFGATEVRFPPAPVEAHAAAEGAASEAAAR